MLKPWSPSHRVVFETNPTSAPPNDLVTICVTAYNYERYLCDCLESLRSQTHQALELIVVDDRSEVDHTVALAEKWMQKHAARFHRCVLVTHLRNQGPSAARNTAFSLALGKYVFVIDADNEAYPRAIARLFEAAVGGGFDATYPQLEYFGDVRKLGVADIWDEEALYESNYVDVMALISLNLWQTVGGYSHIEEGWEDYDFWLKCCRMKAEIGYVPEILCRYRVHGRSRTTNDAHASHEKLKRIFAMLHPQPRCPSENGR